MKPPRSTKATPYSPVWHPIGAVGIRERRWHVATLMFPLVRLELEPRTPTRGLVARRNPSPCISAFRQECTVLCSLRGGFTQRGLDAGFERQFKTRIDMRTLGAYLRAHGQLSDPDADRRRIGT